MQLYCVICWELLSHTSDVCAIPCGHIFHLMCLNRWLERSQSCPQCRNFVVTGSVIKLYLMECIAGDGEHIPEGQKSKFLEQKKELDAIRKSRDFHRAKNVLITQKIEALEKDIEQKKAEIASMTEKLSSFNYMQKIVKESAEKVDKCKKELQELQWLLMTAPTASLKIDKIIRDHQNNPGTLSLLCFLWNKHVQEFAERNLQVWGSLRNNLQQLWEQSSEYKSNALSAANRAFKVSEELRSHLEKGLAVNSRAEEQERASSFLKFIPDKSHFEPCPRRIRRVARYPRCSSKELGISTHVT